MQLKAMRYKDDFQLFDGGILIIKIITHMALYFNSPQEALVIYYYSLEWRKLKQHY